MALHIHTFAEIFSFSFLGGEDSLTAYCEPFGKAMPPTTSNNHKNTCNSTTLRPDSIASAVDSDLEAILIGKANLLFKILLLDCDSVKIS